MAEDADPKKAVEEGVSSDSGNEIGEDWESAFQAEDFLFSPEEENASVFHEEEQPESAAVEDKTAHPSLDAIPDNIVTGAPAAKAEVEVVPSIPFSLSALVNQLAHAFNNSPLVRKIVSFLPAALKQRYDPLHEYLKSVVFLAPALVSLVVLGSLLIPENDRVEKDLASSAGKDKMYTYPIDQGQIRSSDGEDETTTDTSTSGKEKVKWPFASFFIVAASPAGDENIAFVTVELTLVAAVNPGEELPEEKKTFLRDIIYQFYKNRPLEELRRYSLARGDMKRELKAWIEKQWPASTIDSILFNKYQIS